MKIALVHDDIVQWGGAERVLLALAEIYPDAPIYTSLYDKNNPLLKQFSSRKIITSFLQKIPGWKKLYKILLPLYPLAFEQFNFSEFDLVISQTTRFAKSVVTKPKTLHICYCHTPPRFLWHFSGEKSYGLGELLFSKLRIYDTVSAGRVDFFIAGSENARRRIKKVYRADSKVVYPFVEPARFKGIESFDGGYFAAIGRPNKYKKFDLAMRVCQKKRVPLKLISGSLSDEDVLYVLAGAKALIICAEEDFGLSSLEAQALGKPVIAFGKGGVRETVISGKTGFFFDAQTEEELVKALDKLNDFSLNPKDCKKNAAKFDKETFIKNFKQAVTSLC